MVNVKTAVVSVVAVLSIFLQLGVRPQSTFRSSTEDDSCSQLEEGCEFETVENVLLRSVLETNRQKMEALENELRRVRSRELQSVTATFISSLDNSQSHHGITKVEDKIYVIVHNPNRISIYEDLIGFRFVRNIALGGTNWPHKIVYSDKFKCVFIGDLFGKCIWMMTTTGEHQLTKWMANVTWPLSLSLSNEGHLLLLKAGEQFSQLEIYSLNASPIRRLQLPEYIKEPFHVVQTTTGNFIIPHRLNTKWFGPWVISQLTNDGQLINQFTPRNKSEELNEPRHLALDSEKDLLFVADYDNNRVVLLDSSDLTWSQVLIPRKLDRTFRPYQLFYNAKKKHLFVAQYDVNVTVYQIN